MVDFSTNIQDDLGNIKELENQRNNLDATLCQYQEQLKKLCDKLKNPKKKEMVIFNTDIQDGLVDIERLERQISDLYTDLVQTRIFLNIFCNKLKEISKKKEMVDSSTNIQYDLVDIERLERQINELDNKLKFGETGYNKLLE